MQDTTPANPPSIGEDMVQGLWQWLMTSGVPIGITIIVALVVAVIAGVIVGRIQKLVSGRSNDSESIKRINTLFGLVKKIIRITIFVLALLIILSEIGVDMAPILASVGVLGLAFSFGAQSLVKDIISGFFLLAEDQIRVGDVVQIGDHSGTVEDIRIRTVILRDLDGNTHVIPNGIVESFINMSKEFSRAKMDIGVGYREDLDRVFTLIEEEGKALAEEEEYRSLITEPITVMGLQDLADSAVVIRCVMTTKPGDQWAVKRRFLYRIKKRFDAEGVEIPFPHRTIYWGEPAAGKQQGLDIRLGRKTKGESEKPKKTSSGEGIEISASIESEPDTPDQTEPS